MSATRQFPLRRFAILFDQIEAAAFTGRILGQSSNRSCELYFNKGEFIHAVSAEGVGEAAVYTLLGWESGTLTVQTGFSTTEHSLDRQEQALLHETIKLFQNKGIFDKPQSLDTLSSAMSVADAGVMPAPLAAPATRPVVPNPLPSASSGGSEVDAVYRQLSQPVSWGSKLEMTVSSASTASATFTSLKQPVLNRIEIPRLEPSSELETPLSIDLTTGVTLPRLDSEAPSAAKVIEQESVQPSASFGFYLPPGQQAEPSLHLHEFKLEELIGRVCLNWPNGYILLNSRTSEGAINALLVIEGGVLTAVRCARQSDLLRGQAAYNVLESQAASRADTEVTVYAADPKMLACYRTLIGGTPLLTAARAGSLDVGALVGEQVRDRTTVALRFYNERTLVFYLIYAGEVLGSFQTKGNRMEGGGDLKMLLSEADGRLDMLELAPPESVGPTQTSQMLEPGQISLLTEASGCILQLLETLSGRAKVLTSARRVLEGAVGLFPCLQRLGVSERSDRIAFSWTLDQTQAFVTRSEAQAAFNFFLTALMNQHNDLLGQETLRELARRALQNNGLDLKREHLILDCVA